MIAEPAGTPVTGQLHDKQERGGTAKKEKEKGKEPNQRSRVRYSSTTHMH